MLRRKELPAEGINAVARLSQKTSFIALILSGHCAGVFGHVRCFESFVVVEDSRIKPTVKVGVGLDKKMVGEQAPAIAQHSPQDAGVLRAVAWPRLEPRSQIRLQARAEDEQSHRSQLGDLRRTWNEVFH